MKSYPFLAQHSRIVPLSSRTAKALGTPHCGEQEAARRRRQMERNAAKAAARTARSGPESQSEREIMRRLQIPLRPR